MQAIEVSPFNKEVFNGKVVAVTGGSSGIGLEIARQFGKFSLPAFSTRL